MKRRLSKHAKKRFHQRIEYMTDDEMKNYLTLSQFVKKKLGLVWGTDKKTLVTTVPGNEDIILDNNPAGD